MIFEINGLCWGLKYIPGNSPLLIDRTGKRTVAVTDVLTKMIFVAKGLSIEFTRKVVSHELMHCILYSYNLLETLHMMTIPDYIYDMEEFICNIYADYCVDMNIITDTWLQISLRERS